MGMLLHRHLVEADLANKPVESEVAETVQEVPKDIEQAVVEEETIVEPEEVKKKPTVRRLTRKSK